MIKTLLSICAAMLGVAAIVWLASFFIWGDAETRTINGTILKDSSGNYYKLEQHIGKTFTVEVITVEEIF